WRDEGARVPAVRRARARQGRDCAQSPHGRNHRIVAVGAGAGTHHRNIVQGIPPACVPGAGAAARSARSDPGRTHRRPRSQPAERGARADPRHGARPRDHPVHARAQRSQHGLQSRGDPGRRPPACAGHAGGTGGAIALSRRGEFPRACQCAVARTAGAPAGSGRGRDRFGRRARHGTAARGCAYPRRGPAHAGRARHQGRRIATGTRPAGRSIPPHHRACRTGEGGMSGRDATHVLDSRRLRRGAFAGVLLRELRSYLITPVAWLFTVIFLLLAGALTFYLGGLFERGQADLQPFFQFHPWLYLVLVPALAMRLWAEERRSGTLELLLTLPIRPWEAVLAKFCAAWICVGVALALTFPMWLTIDYLG